MSDEVNEELVTQEAPAEEIPPRDPIAALTEDLQRLQAEYANYKKRVDRDRILISEVAIANTLTDLLPVLDDIERASEHGELTGGFKAVSDQLISIITKLGLERYGDAPCAFDPKIHEALMHETSGEVSETTVTRVLQIGYRFKERILRPARVLVTDPE